MVEDEGGAFDKLAEVAEEEREMAGPRFSGGNTAAVGFGSKGMRRTCRGIIQLVQGVDDEVAKAVITVAIAQAGLHILKRVRCPTRPLRGLSPDKYLPPMSLYPHPGSRHPPGSRTENLSDTTVSGQGAPTPTPP